MSGATSPGGQPEATLRERFLGVLTAKRSRTRPRALGDTGEQFPVTVINDLLPGNDPGNAAHTAIVVYLTQFDIDGCPADTPFTFTWVLTVPHPTSSFRYFITREDWNPNRPLTRNDLELTPFLTVPFGGLIPPPFVANLGTLPDRSGRAMILSVWDIANSQDAYYQCADVFFI